MAQISSTLTLADHLGASKARWAIGRMNYFVPAGLYALGNPTPNDPVVVTANYKMSYDSVRSSLVGRNAWMLVLETYGINVWCAAGKGTFGTEELVQRIAATNLASVVKHRRLILPILGAPGVAAYQVVRQSGFSVRYSTIRADDLPEYLDNGMKTTPAMQELTFSLRERLVLIPVEFVLVLKTLCIWGAVLFLAATLMYGLTAGISALVALIGAVLTGIALTPILLPWIPVRSFAVKGALTGLAWSIVFYFFANGTEWSPGVTIATFLALPAISAFYALNFTGCTNFTSRSGVKKEMRLGIPVIQPEKLRNPEAMLALRAWAPNLIVVAAFGQILRADVLELPKWGCINIHGSLLPRGRGAAPIQAAILAGDQQTGITIMKMDPGVDTGPMLSQRAIPISPEDTAGTLFEKLAPIGAELLLETLSRYLSRELQPQPQPAEGITYAPMLKKEDGRLDFTQPAAALERRVRAFTPWPGSWFEWNGAPLKVVRAHVSEKNGPGAGDRLIFEGYPAIGTGAGILVLEEIQPAGKKSMPGKAFLAGTREWENHE